MGFDKPGITKKGSTPRLRVPADRKELAVIRNFVQSQALTAGFSSESIDDLYFSPASGVLPTRTPVPTWTQACLVVYNPPDGSITSGVPHSCQCCQ